MDEGDQTPYVFYCHLPVTFLTPFIVLTTMAREARCRIDPAVDLVLREVVSPVWHGPLWRILVLIARLELFLVRVAVSAEGFHMAEVADLLLLRRVELVTRAEVGGVVQGCAPILVAVGADGQCSRWYFTRMFFCQACICGTGE